jgi:exonuclease VII large subunit
VQYPQQVQQQFQQQQRIHLQQQQQMLQQQQQQQLLQQQQQQQQQMLQQQQQQQQMQQQMQPQLLQNQQGVPCQPRPIFQQPYLLPGGTTWRPTGFGSPHGYNGQSTSGNQMSSHTRYLNYNSFTNIGTVS